jgi:hypothetical protein
MEGESRDDIDVEDVSPTAWKLIRVAAGYEQRGVEREIDDLMQAHVSMLENDTRSLSRSRLETLFELYAEELSDEQIAAIVSNF